MLSINYRNSQPIYGQIKDGLRRLIVTGALEPDEKLPSVRALAMDLAINPNTIQRAYAELEREGFIYSVAGKGSFAASPDRTDILERKALLIARLREILAELRFLQVTDAELIALVGEGAAQ